MRRVGLIVSGFAVEEAAGQPAAPEQEEAKEAPKADAGEAAGQPADPEQEEAKEAPKKRTPGASKQTRA